MGHKAKQFVTLAFIIFLILFCIFFAYPYIKKFQSRTTAQNSTAQNDLSAEPDGSPATVEIDGSTLNVTIANTDASRDQGLGGRGSLGDNEGMLFVFDTPGEYAFWMKDMVIPIDMAWVGPELAIVHIESNVSPSTYPNSLSPGSPALYVIETNANYFSSHNISVGDIVDIKD
jgi:uncharacterized membrane protein (UPF0127 family)